MLLSTSTLSIHINANASGDGALCGGGMAAVVFVNMPYYHHTVLGDGSTYRCPIFVKRIPLSILQNAIV
jgi:hypothetical protein